MKHVQNERYEIALEKNIHDIVYAISEYNIAKTISDEYPRAGWDFFRISFYSLSNDMLARSMRVLDLHKDAASFKYIYNIQKSEVEKFAKNNSINIKEIESLTKKLGNIRDKVLFHIDKKCILDQNQIWEKADLTGDFFFSVLSNLLKILQHLYQKHFGKEYHLRFYDGEEVKKILNACRSMRIIGN